MRRRTPIFLLASLVSMLVLASAAAAGPLTWISSGRQLLTSVDNGATDVATLAGDYAYPPVGAPSAVRSAIQAGNQLRHKPYVWGGGHMSFMARGYDCSGSVSYVLHAAGLLDQPEVSGALMKYGKPGPGRWITIYANRTHALAYIAGLRFDTSGMGQSGPRWRPEPRDLGGFAVRHPAGY